MKIKVYEDRYLVSEEINGSQYENLATTLEFEFPEYIEKNGEKISTNELNKYIVFDINEEENQDIIINNKYSIPYELTQTEKITFIVKMAEISDNIDVSDKLIWNSQKMTIILNETLEGHTNITSQKLDAFNTAVTTLNQKTTEVDNTIKEVETKVETGQFNGADGLTPYIKNQYWYIGKENTQVKAEGTDGKDYILNEEDKKEISEIVETDIQPVLDEVKDTSERAESIAKGKATGYVFDTLIDLDLWLQDIENTSKLVLGDNLYIREVGVPDYWWDGEQKQQLETQKVDLSEYTKSTDYATSAKAGLMRPANGLFVSGNSGAIVVAKASEAQIDAKADKYYPIVPSNLDYAVKKALTDTTTEWSEEEKEKANSLLGNAKDVYSLEEVKTNKIWIDGKPIYRKVLECSSFYGWSSVQHNIKDFEFATFVYGIRFADGWTEQLPYVTSDGQRYVKSITGVSSTEIFLNTGDLVQGKRLIIVIEYTKTTD